MCHRLSEQARVACRYARDLEDNNEKYASGGLGMSLLVKQGAVHYCHFDPPTKSRPVLVLSRTELNNVRENVIVALATRKIRNIPTEIPVGKDEGLVKKGVVSLADIHTVPKSLLSEEKGEFSSAKFAKAIEALKLVFAMS